MIALLLMLFLGDDLSDQLVKVKRVYVDRLTGGETAAQVGKKLRGLGRSHQVLCITHLSQVAAQGQSHFAVEKKTKQNRTVTELTRLEGATRQRELARMLGGQTEAALALAKSLLAETGRE